MTKKIKSSYTIGPDVDLSRTIIRDKNGKRITNARAEKMAESALRKVGRPSLSSKAVHSPEVKARVPLKLKTALDREAKRRGETTSALVREALEKFLKSA